MLANQAMFIEDMPIGTVFDLGGTLYRKVTRRTCEVVPVSGFGTRAKRYYFSKNKYGTPIVPTTNQSKLKE